MDSLYHFRDHFFDFHPIEEANVKNDRLKQKLEECIKKMDQISGETSEINDH